MSVSVRTANSSDVSDVVRVHESAFPGFFLTLLGGRFLEHLYSGFLEQAISTLLVAENGSARIVGLLAGSRDPALFFRRMRRERGGRMALAAIPALMCHPIRVADRLMAAVTYRGDQPPELPGYWLLSSLGVDAAHAGAGIGEALVAQYCDLARRGGARGVYLLTDEQENQRAQRFYLKCGFSVHSKHVRRDGRRLAVISRSFCNE